VAAAAFHLAFLYAPLSWLVLVWLGCLFALRRTQCGRWAFYTGLAIGLASYGPQLRFFWNIFGPPAIALWLVLAFWLALFVLLLHGVDRWLGPLAVLATAVSMIGPGVAQHRTRQRRSTARDLTSDSELLTSNR
jgi:hypothetical protein